MVRAYLLRLLTNADDLSGWEYLGGWALATGVLAILPLFMTTYWVKTLVLANVFALFTISWNVLGGRTDYISFGHSFLIGAAGYATAILTTSSGLPLAIAFPLAILFALFAGVLIFIPSLKLRGAYFTFVTLMIPILAERLVIRQSDLTGGVRGIIGVPSLSGSVLVNYYASMGLMIGAGLVLWILFRSDLGTVLRMIRESEDLVENSGINPFKFKLLIFVLSAVIAGVGGAFKVAYLGSVTIDSVLYLTLSINIVIAAIIGGRGSVAGAVGGAYFFVLYEAYMRTFLASPTRHLLFFLLGIVFVSLFPEGVIPRALQRLRERSDATETAGESTV